MAKNLIEELTSYRVKVEKDGKEIVNIPSIIALPGVLMAPKVSIIGTVAASLLGCSIHVENDKGTAVDVSERIRKATDTLADTAKTVREEIGKAWDAMSADDPEGCPAGEENADENPAEAQKPAAEEFSNEDIVEDLKKQEKPDIPTIQVNPDDSTMA